jgi:hypothetical protein
MDQSLSHAVRSYGEHVEARDVLLANEQAARGEAEDANWSKDVSLASLKPGDAHAAERHSLAAGHLAARQRRRETS